LMEGLTPEKKPRFSRSASTASRDRCSVSASARSCASCLARVSTSLRLEAGSGSRFSVASAISCASGSRLGLAPSTLGSIAGIPYSGSDEVMPAGGLGGRSVHPVAKGPRCTVAPVVAVVIVGDAVVCSSTRARFSEGPATVFPGGDGRLLVRAAWEGKRIATGAGAGAGTGAGTGLEA
jgi:hypothetical protein